MCVSVALLANDDTVRFCDLDYQIDFGSHKKHTIYLGAVHWSGNEAKYGSFNRVAMDRFY